MQRSLPCLGKLHPTSEFFSSRYIKVFKQQQQGGRMERRERGEDGAEEKEEEKNN